MSRFEELIQKYCPEGVDWRRIEDICNTLTPPCKLKTKEFQEEGAYPIIDQGQKQIAGFTDEKEALVHNGEYILYGDHTCIVKYHNGRFAQGADGLKILTSPSNNPKYVYYALSAFNLKSTEYKRHWTQAKEIEIPIPPLPVQEEIVRILDTFTELQAELQAELQKRLQQYNYYRDNLLSFEGRTDVERKSVSSVAQVCRGVRVVKSQLSDKGYPVYQNCLTPMGFYDKTNCPGGTPFVICGGAASDVGYSDVDCWAADDCEYIIANAEMCGRFIYHCLMAQKQYLASRVRKASIPRLSPNVIKELKIPIPTLKEQQEIASILDKFDALTIDLVAGIPAEIEKRRQQYEHYRNSLLSFRRRVL